MHSFNLAEYTCTCAYTTDVIYMYSGGHTLNYIHVHVRLLPALTTARTYTITVKTGGAWFQGTDSAIFLTMYDASDSSCVSTRLDNGHDIFERNA